MVLNRAWNKHLDIFRHRIPFVFCVLRTRSVSYQKLVSFDCLPSSLFHPDVLSCRWWNLAPSCPLDYTRPDPMGQDLANRLLVSCPALLGSRRVARTSRYSSTSMTCLLESSESSCLTDPVIPPCHTAMTCGFSAATTWFPGGL